MVLSRRRATSAFSDGIMKVGAELVRLPAHQASHTACTPAVSVRIICQGPDRTVRPAFGVMVMLISFLLLFAAIGATEELTAKLIKPMVNGEPGAPAGIGRSYSSPARRGWAVR